MQCLRWTEARCVNAAAIRLLIAKGLDASDIAEVAEALERKKDPSNADRQARYRERRKAARVTRYSNGVTPPIEDNHTPSPDISSDEESQSKERDDCEAVVESWNAMAKATGLSTCAKLNPARRKACRARLRDDGLQAIQMAIQHIPKSAFLRGETGNWSGANINFLLRPDTVTRILEGQYDDRPDKNLRQGSGSSPDSRNSLTRACDEALDFLGG